METGLNAGPEIFTMPALSNDQNHSNDPRNNGQSSTTEFLCHINHPEDVGAVVTSLCKVVEDGQIQVCQFFSFFRQDFADFFVYLSYGICFETCFL